MEWSFRKQIELGKGTLLGLCMSYLCLSLFAGLDFVSPQNSFIYMENNMSVDFYTLQLQSPKKA